MKPAAIYTFIIILCLAAGCKKKANQSAITGSWNFANVTGTVTSTTGPDSGHYTYSYNPTDSLISYTVTSVSHPLPLTTNFQLAETWSISANDSLYSAWAYQPLNQPQATGANRGAYTYTDSLLFVETGSSQLLMQLGIDNPPYIGGYDQFKVESLSPTQMVLNYNALVNDSNSIAQVNFTITFSK